MNSVYTIIFYLPFGVNHTARPRIRVTYHDGKLQRSYIYLFLTKGYRKRYKNFKYYTRNSIYILNKRNQSHENIFAVTFQIKIHDI